MDGNRNGGSGFDDAAGSVGSGSGDYADGVVGSVWLFFILDGPFPSFRSLVALSLPFQKCDTDDDREQQLLAHHNNNGIRIINILGKL